MNSINKETPSSKGYNNKSPNRFDYKKPNIYNIYDSDNTIAANSVRRWYIDNAEKPHLEGIFDETFVAHNLPDVIMHGDWDNTANTAPLIICSDAFISQIPRSDFSEEGFLTTNEKDSKGAERQHTYLKSLSKAFNRDIIIITKLHPDGDEQWIQSIIFYSKERDADVMVRKAVDSSISLKFSDATSGHIKAQSIQHFLSHIDDDFYQYGKYSIHLEDDNSVWDPYVSYSHQPSKDYKDYDECFNMRCGDAYQMIKKIMKPIKEYSNFRLVDNCEGELVNLSQQQIFDVPLKTGKTKKINLSGEHFYTPLIFPTKNPKEFIMPLADKDYKTMMEANNNDPIIKANDNIIKFQEQVTKEYNNVKCSDGIQRDIKMWYCQQLYSKLTVKNAKDYIAQLKGNIKYNPFATPSFIKARENRILKRKPRTSLLDKPQTKIPNSYWVR